MKLIKIILVLILISIDLVLAAPPVEKMQKSTVLIACIINESYGNIGTGFAINEKDIVTNQHVINCVHKSGRILIIFQEKKLQGQIVWESDNKDLAIIRNNLKHGIPVAILKDSSSVKVTDTVYAAGFPTHSGLNLLDRESLLTVKISKGIVTAKVKTKENVKLLQIDAPINPGNSGGPLFNEEGYVIGINWAKAQSIVVALDPETMTLKPQRVPDAEGVGWAIESDELINELIKANISFNKANIFYSFPLLHFFKKYFIFVLAIISVLIASSVILLRKKTKYSEIINLENISVNLKKKKPLLISLEGPIKGATIEFDNKPITIGRDPTMSNLIIKDPENIVSKRHCTIRFDFFEKKFYIIDHSRNGTFLKNGIRISDKIETELESGDRFYLSKPDFLFEVKLE